MPAIGAPDPVYGRLVRRAAAVSLSVAALLVFIEVVAYGMTGSVAILASLVDSALDVLSSALILLAVSAATVPADDEHRFGHAKAEPLAALAQVGFIAASLFFLTVSAVDRLVHPRPLEHGAVGISLMLLSTLVTVGLVGYQQRIVRRTGSLAIRADRLHYVADLCANLAVVVAVFGAGYRGIAVLDPLVALLVVGWLGWGTVGMAREALDQLMDRELPDAIRIDLLERSARVDGVMRVHDLRTRAAGNRRFVQMRVDVDGSLSLERAHAIADAIEQVIHDALPDAEVLIHQEPVAAGRPAGRQH